MNVRDKVLRSCFLWGRPSPTSSLALKEKEESQDENFGKMEIRSLEGFVLALLISEPFLSPIYKWFESLMPYFIFVMIVWELGETFQIPRSSCWERKSGAFVFAK